MTPSRLTALKPWLAVALGPAVLALLVMPGGVAAIVAIGWLLLVGTVAMAATSQRPERPNTSDPRGRLHG